MADAAQKKDSGESAAKKESAESKETKLPRDQLVAEAEGLLGEKRYVVAGAMSAEKGDGPMTVKEAQGAVERFLKREITTEEA